MGTQDGANVKQARRRQQISHNHHAAVERKDQHETDTKLAAKKQANLNSKLEKLQQE